MTLSIYQLAYFFLIGLSLALLEIEIEGPDGWAKNLPTKRIKIWWYQKFGKEVTGYHLLLQIFLLLFMHLPLILENRFSWDLEALILSQYFFFLVYWDYLWFVAACQGVWLEPAAGQEGKLQGDVIAGVFCLFVGLELLPDSKCSYLRDFANK